MSVKSELRWLLVYALVITANIYDAVTTSNPVIACMDIAIVLLYSAMIVYICDRLRWFVGLVLRCFIGRL